MKPGYKTTEFWVVAIGSLVAALLALFVGYGAITSEQSELWAGLIMAAVPIAIAIMSASYSNSRAKVKAPPPVNNASFSTGTAARTVEPGASRGDKMIDETDNELTGGG